MSLSIRSQIEAPLQASKWLTCPVLLDRQEMNDLFAELDQFWIFQVSGLLKMTEGEILREEFLKGYEQYVHALKNGFYPDDQLVKRLFSTIFTSSFDALYEVHLANSQKLIRVDKPVIQLQSHRFDYSSSDKKFRSRVLGSSSIYWGIQFSYPQLFQDRNFQVKNIREGEEFPNTSLFKKLQRWVRHYTIPTTFMVENQKVNVPIRLGKQCLKWINNHPQLPEKGLVVIENKQILNAE
jgi:hypothetical protein